MLPVHDRGARMFATVFGLCAPVLFALSLIVGLVAWVFLL